ncbi:MAG: RloB domain-containing protein [Deltaproteobacteria bacterium]|nr:RloB domain-containing protein [Deltaproteobacteria bacterium]
MPPKRRSFERPPAQRRYRKIFIIAAEGTVTEPQYFNIFNMFNDPQSIIRVKCLKGNHNCSPPQVLERMNRYIKEAFLHKSDEAWLVVDKDQWTDEQLKQLHNSTQTKDNYYLALSNPKFEYWLLLHFEAGRGISTSNDCSDRLRKHLPDYDKSISRWKITPEMINKAVERAKQRDNPPCPDWPRKPGTTVYRLVENILNAPEQVA